MIWNDQFIEWERLIHRLSTQHNFKFEPRQLFAILIRGLPEDLRLTMNRDGVVEFLDSSRTSHRVLSKQATFRSDSFKRSQLSRDVPSPEKEPRKGVPKGRYADGKSGISWDQKGRGKQGKGKGKKEHDYASMFYYFLDGHSRSNLHVSLPIQDFIRLVRGSWQSRESTTRKTPYRTRAECGNSGTKKEHRKEEARKDEIIRLHIQPIHGVSHRIHGMRQVRRILGIDR